MKTEARKSFYHGFVLTEQELRRTIDTATQQLAKLSPKEIHTFIELKFRNGTITQAASIDDLLAIENVGSKEITRLHIHLSHEPPQEAEDDGHKPDHIIGLTFRNPEQDDDPRSISYGVRSLERDWALVTASELEERMTKIRHRSPRAILRPGRTFSTSGLIPTLFFTALLLAFAIALIRTAKPPESIASSLESRWKAGALHDPIEAIIIVQKDVEKRLARLDPTSAIIQSAYITFAGAAALGIITTLAIYLSPAFVFKWGDNIARYERRVQIRNFVLGAVLLAFIVGIAASVIGNKITAH